MFHSVTFSVDTLCNFAVMIQRDWLRIHPVENAMLNGKCSSHREGFRKGIRSGLLGSLESPVLEE